MRITNLNPDADIGASAWWLEIDGYRLLLDAGIHPKIDGRAALPLYSRVAGEEADAIAISHCHHDHVGSLPVAMRLFPEAQVLMTELTYFLVERALHNSVNVMTRQREELGVREYPLYTHTELDEQLERYQGFRYEREVEWGGFSRSRRGTTSPTLEFRDAGHTLGSAGIMVRGRDQTLFYTGDVSFQDQTLLRGARFEDVQADVLILETTRGGRDPVPGQTRETEVTRLLGAIQRVLARGGRVLIPTFALGRTQEILAMLALWMREGALPRMPVHIGGLGRVFTEIYDLESHRANRRHTSLLLHEALDLKVLGRRRADAGLLRQGQLFVLTAGMMTEHTAAHDLAIPLMADPANGILLVGYVDPDTPGGRLKASRRGRPFLFSASAGEVTRQCELEAFDLTAHANREELLEFVGEVNPGTVLLGHGDAAARQWFDAAIRERHPRMKVLQPAPGETVTEGA
ncbi:MAG: MBL fold metallo-hydrolase [Verrucomicrobiales bacterium]|nr:MBL fold metallo-hydrolase [Verrucomicrobiales bacterium]